MSARRWMQYLREKPFTVFVAGVSHNDRSSLPMLVQASTTGDEILFQLQRLRLVPAGMLPQMYLLHGRRFVEPNNTLAMHGVGELSHLSLRCRSLGGASGDKKRKKDGEESDAKERKQKKTKNKHAKETDRKSQLTKPERPRKGVGGRPTNASKRKRDPDREALYRDTTPPSGLAPVPATPDGASLPSKVLKFSPRTRRTVTFGLSALTFSDDESDTPPKLRARTSKQKPTRKSPKERPLNKVKRASDDGWVRLGSTSTGEVYKYFESQLRGKSSPVYRATYKCLGNCTPFVDPGSRKRARTSATDSESSESRSEVEQSSEPSDAGSEASGVCPERVKLQLEICSDDLGKTFFYQRGKHGPAHPDDVQISQYIRQCIMEYAMLANMTAGRIKRRLTKAYETFKTPKHRRPTAANVENMVANIRRAERLDTDPLISVGIFAKRNSDKIFHYTPANETTTPPSGFATGIKTDHSLQSLLLWGHQNGIGLDSCWRNKNENRAPVTFVTTIDHNRRMLPGPVYISANITAETLKSFLRQVKQLVELMAVDILRGRKSIHTSHKTFAKEMKKATRLIEANNGHWVPSFVMIDKSRAELNALLAGESVF
uniref:Ubiquitin-like domain-containing protein n=1 Tax=Mycena chlorophos TaxID=658473 RepID=A0ABQ0L1K0_MYCCL|nr:predicted protein [Mycena chlorophos]